MEQFQAYWENAINLIMLYAPKVLLAIVVLLVGLRIIKIITRAMDRAMEKAQTDLSLRRFLTSLIGILFKIILIISVASMIDLSATLWMSTPHESLLPIISLL